MAGQRMYYSNVLTNTKGSVQLTSQIYNAPGNTTTVPSVVNGAGFSVSGINTTTFTVNVPERFAPARVHNIDVTYVPATTLMGVALISAAYTTPTVLSTPSSFQFQVWQIGVSTATALQNPCGQFYVQFEAALGM